MLVIADVQPTQTNQISISDLVQEIQNSNAIEIALDWDHQDGDYFGEHIIDFKDGSSIDFNITCKGELWGQGFEVESVVFDPEIEELQEKIAKKLGYQLKGHKLELYGVPLKKNG